VASIIRAIESRGLDTIAVLPIALTLLACVFAGCSLLFG
jgi:hypothetical protein